jgi:hypothetical protein
MRVLVFPVRSILVTLLAASLPLISVAASPIAGSFALQGGTPKANGYLLATQIGSDPLLRRIDTWMTPTGSTAALRSYENDMTKYLHMIVVSDDFRTFLHVHPVLGSDGHFLLDQRFPAAGRYYVYADAHPAGIGHQVFRYALDIGGAATEVQRDLSERSTSRNVGPYTVTISTATLTADGKTPLVVHVTENGKPASDLHPYLGALAHAVFLNAEDLSYVHAHPMPLTAANIESLKSAAAEPMEPKPMPDTATSAPDMLLHAELREAGTYKLWLQFRGASKLYVAPFIITARGGH